MEKTIDESKFQNTLRTLIVNSLVNNYAVERVAFGYEKPDDIAPVDLYLKHLHLNINDGLHKRSDVYGIYIDENEHISAEQDYAEFVRDLFVLQMQSVFDEAPKDIRLDRDSEELPFMPRFRDYLFGLLPLFTEILNVEVKYDAFDVMPTATASDEYDKWRKFVTAILIKPLRSGSQINRYVKDFTDAPYYVRRLIEKKGSNYFLKPLDMNSYDYAFAVFSLMKFMNAENGKLFELKMREWERRNKSE